MRLLLLIVAGWAGLAQESTSAPTVAALVQGATTEVLIAAPELRSRALAEALREALVVRGVRVYLLLPDAGADERAAYALSLELAGAALRRYEGVGESFAVIDRTLLLIGRGIGVLDDAMSAPVTVQRDPAAVAAAITWFYQAFGAGTSKPPEALFGSGRAR